MPSFRTKLSGTATSPTGIVVPSDIIEALGKGKKPAVIVTINDTFTFRSTVGSMGGAFVIPVSAGRRKAAGVRAGDAIDVVVERDDVERTLEPPEDFTRALAANAVAKIAFEKLPPSHKKEHVRAIEEAKKPETRARRIEAAIAKLGEH